MVTREEGASSGAPRSGRRDRRWDLVVVGGGVIGLSIAFRAAREGIGVAVIDPNPGRGASWVAAGMIAPVSEASFGDRALAELFVAGAQAWPNFVSELGEMSGFDIEFRACGTVAVGMDQSDRTVIDELTELRRSLGLEVKPAGISRLRSLVPALSPAVRGGAEMPGDHQVENRRVVEALLEGCRRAQVTIALQQAVDLVGSPGDSSSPGDSRKRRVNGVRLDDGRELLASATVVATGWSPAFSASAGTLLPPVRPVKGHIVRLGPGGRPPLLERTVSGLVHGRPCYLVPRLDGSLVVGATSEERGLELGVQAGALHNLLHDARSLVPGIDELELLETMTGLRPGTPDNAPFVGRTEADGLLVATGHYRHGFLLAPLTAEAVVTLLNEEPPAPWLAVCDPARPLGLGTTQAISR